MRASLRLVLVRHGETEWTNRGLLHRRLDSPLSALGQMQAELTARRLMDGEFDALYSSPQGRAIETAQILGRGLGLNVSSLDGLKEIYYGWLEGKPLSLVDPDGSGAVLMRPFARLILALTGERPRDVASRVRSALDLMIARHPHGNLLVVTHWGILSVLMAHILDVDPSKWRKYGPWAACGITMLRAADGEWRADRINDHAHLRKGKES